MKKCIMVLICVISLFFTYVTTLPVSADTSNEIYKISNHKALELKKENDEIGEYFKCFDIVKTDEGTFLYAGKENTSGDGGLYIYDISSGSEARLIEYKNSVGGASINHFPVSGRICAMTCGEDNYLLFFSNDNAYYSCKINSDGTLNESECRKFYDCGFVWMSNVQAIGEYVMVNGMSGFRVYKAENGDFTEIGRVDTKEICSAELMVSEDEISVALGLKENDGKYIELYKSDIGKSLSFNMAAAYKYSNDNTYDPTDLCFMGERTILAARDQGGADVFEYDEGGNLIRSGEIPIRTASVKAVGNGSFLLGGNSRIYLFEYLNSIPQSEIESQNSMETEIRLFEGKAYSLGWSGALNIYDYKTSVEIIKNTDSVVCPTYNLECHFSGIEDDDRVIVDINGEESNVKEELENNILKKSIPVSNGEYIVSVKIIRDGEVLVSDFAKFSVNLKYQIEITDFIVADNIVNMNIKNIYSYDLQSGTVLVFAYDENGIVFKQKKELKNFSGTDNIQLDIPGLTSEMSVTAFVVGSFDNPKLCSNIINTENNGFLTDVDKSTTTHIDGKLNILQNIEPGTNKFTTTVAGKKEPGDLLIFIFNSDEKTFDNLCFAYAGSSDDEGYAAVSYTISDTPAEGSIYYTNASFGKFDKWIFNCSLAKSYYGIDTVRRALDEIKKSDETTVYSVLTDDVYSKIFQIDFDSDWKKLESNYQNAVLKGIAGREYASVTELVNKFNISVSEQIKKQNDDKMDSELVESINAASESTISSLMEDSQNAERLGIRLNGLFTLLGDTQKNELYKNYILNKGFLDKAAVESAFSNGLCVTFISSATYIKIVSDGIVEKHGDELGISSENINKYKLCSNKADIIKAFLNNKITSKSDVNTAFSGALTTPNSSENNTSHGRGSSGSSSKTILPAGEAVKTISPEDIVPNQKPEDHDDEIVFNDVKNDSWYYDAVYGMARKGYVDGTEKNSFSPDEPVKREEFIKMLIGAFGMIDNSATSSFKDTNELKWHYRYIASAQKAGIVLGDENGYFGTGEYITRQDMAVMIYRALKVGNKQLNVNGDEKYFNDSTNISNYALESVMSLYRSNMINGYPDNTFRPFEIATRAVAAQIIWNIIK